MTLSKITAVVIFMALLLVQLTPAQANTCGAGCNKDSDCYQGGFVECGKCNLYVGTHGYKTCYNHQQPTCGMTCDSDSDCDLGSFAQCAKCNLYYGTEDYKTCYNDEPENSPTPAPSAHDYFPLGGSCSNRCKHDRDCQNGGFNPCGKCGKYAGTVMYQRCYQPEYNSPEESPTPAPSTHDYFPEGGSCSRSCRSDRDCRHGGFNPCGKCGKYEGTLMYQRCYKPEENGGRHLENDESQSLRRGGSM
jgi:hypothetical protein